VAVREDIVERPAGTLQPEAMAVVQKDQQRCDAPQAGQEVRIGPGRSAHARMPE
jgi:hypothetical protein